MPLRRATSCWLVASKLAKSLALTSAMAAPSSVSTIQMATVGPFSSSKVRAEKPLIPVEARGRFG
jgi:predicted deacylase